MKQFIYITESQYLQVKLLGGVEGLHPKVIKNHYSRAFINKLLYNDEGDRVLTAFKKYLKLPSFNIGPIVDEETYTECVYLASTSDNDFNLINQHHYQVEFLDSDTVVVIKKDYNDSNVCGYSMLKSNVMSLLNAMSRIMSYEALIHSNTFGKLTFLIHSKEK